MKTANNLVQALSESFDDSLSKPTDNRITAPILVIYSGKYSAQHDDNIMNAFRQVWLRARADHICRAVRDKQNLKPVIGENEDIFKYADTMYQCDEAIFDDFSKLTVVTIYDSRDYLSPEDMIHDYESDGEYFSRETFENKNTTVVRIIVLEDSREKSEFEKYMRKHLSQQSEEGNCKGTILVSTTSSNGRQKSYAQIYDLIGKVITVGCTDSEINRVDVFGSYGDGAIRTVSCTKMERPNTDICAVIIKQYIQWLQNYFSSQSIPAEKVIKERLGITDNGYKITGSIYDKIKSGFPSIDTLKYLPTNDVVKDNEKIENMDFSSYDRLTMHGFEMFYQKYYMSVINDAKTKEHVRNEVKKELKKNFSMPEIMKLTDEMVDNIGEWLKKSIRSMQPGQVVANYIENYNKMNLEPVIAEIIIDEIGNQKGIAKKQKSVIEKIDKDFSQNVIAGYNDSVTRYYSTKVQAYLKEHGEDFVSEVMSDIQTDETGDMQTIYSKMYRYALKMIESRSEFKLAFEDELKARTNDDTGIYGYINTTIMSEASRNIFFNASVAPNSLFRVILMNQRNDGRNTDLYTQMSGNWFKAGNDYFLNNGNSNGIVELQVYSLSSTALL